MASKETLPHLDIFYRTDLWEEPTRLRPYRKQLVPLAPNVVRSRTTKQIMAWLASYHQAHTWQLMEALDVSTFTLSRHLRPMYMAGLLSRGRYNPYGSGAIPYIYQINDSPQTTKWLRDLSYVDWLGVTGGTKISFASNYIRHNMLVGDMVLAASRLLSPVNVVLGERYAAASRLVPGSNSAALGDAVLVTESGLRVVVELVANMVDSLPRKVQRWGRLLATREANELGLVVVFLNAAPPVRQKSMARHLRQMITSGITPQTLGGQDGTWYSDREVDRARSGLVIANWPDWFSPGGKPTFAFGQLFGQRSMDGSTLEPVSILNFPFQPNDPSKWRDPIKNVPYLYSCPQVLRDRLGVSMADAAV